MSQDLTESPQTHHVNAKGLKCPMPVIKLQQMIRQLPPKSIVSIDCTDLSAEKDIQSWCKVNKHTLISIDKTDFGLTLTVKSKN